MIFETKNFFVTIFTIFLNEILIKNVKTITDVTRKRYETTNIRRATMNASLCEFLFDSNLRQTVLAIIKYLLRYICTKNCSHYWTNRCISKRDQPCQMIHTFLVKLKTSSFVVEFSKMNFDSKFLSPVLQAFPGSSTSRSCCYLQLVYQSARRLFRQGYVYHRKLEKTAIESF